MSMFLSCKQAKEAKGKSKEKTQDVKPATKTEE